MNREKRESKRVNVKITGNCTHDSGGVLSHEHAVSCTKNLSPWGAHLIVPKEFKVGDRISLVLSLPGYFIPLLIPSEVRWFKKTRAQNGKDLTEIGVKFLRFDPFDSQKLNDFLRFKEEKISSLV